MNTADRPTLFYLFPKGHDIEISEFTDAKAAKLWKQGYRWLDLPKRTLPEAEQLKLMLLSHSFERRRN
jgi:hypothetical protein